ncbi:putative bifunctional diguanylate cyclase/phosphodiesterase [Neptunomonas qingdaonensis]|uniref:Diguanylate cyclase (GGDEF) domain-containing protein n=1 Tax=Neptunomonas qingdaonensis TaxID=1045558 RepID=A0A1I2U2M2_9GAMM|nr:EAL domain-containing protein [Neptunomonas qingdaonensis]SFG70669.1 diguanylate cyclase (GGDEF) domain-containing protein [Neptunomonas qingdaonensis]
MRLLPVLKRLFFHSPVWSAILVGLLVLCVSSLFIQSEVERLKGEALFRAASQVGIIRARLEGEINANLAVLKALKAEVSINPEMGQYRLDQLMEALLSEELHIRHVALAPDLTVKYVYPLAGNEKAIGLNYTANKDQVRSVLDAIQLNNTVLSGPLQLVQGGEALIARLPVYLSSQSDAPLWGIISAVLDYQKLLDAAGLSENYYGLLLGIRGKDGSGSDGAFFYGSEQAFGKEAVMTNISLPHGEWQLAVLPENGWSVPTKRIYLLWASAFFLAIIMGAAGYFLRLVYQQKIQAVTIANYRANFDALTGLPNRFYFSQRLESLIKEVRRERLDFAIFFIDIDHFKQVNDSLGHSAGDELLAEFASRLQHSARDSDIVARLGGDEFVIVLRNVQDVIQADLLAEKLQSSIQQPFNIGERPFLVTASIGIAMYPIDGEDVTSLLLHSDQAMYTAKRAGRNTHFFFNEGMREEAEQHLQLHNDILRGLNADEFELHYQPILNIKTNQIEKCEALIRWMHPEKGRVMPDAFIPVAERSGAIVNIGNWVLQQACKDMRVLLDADIDVKISVNRSVSEFHSENAYETWENIFKENGVDSHRFVFEITESLFMDQNSARVNVISSLRDIGVQFAIDDFGTGYSAINYLRTYPVDYLKIDKSFIQDLLIDEQDKTLVEVIIKMGRALGILVIAEGVEEPGQLEVLQQFECDYIQGYWLSKPQPLSQTVSICHEHMSKQNTL